MNVQSPELLRERFKRLPVPICLCQVAENVNRIALVLDGLTTRDGARALVEEGISLVAWTNTRLEFEPAQELEALRRELVTWSQEWDGVWDDSEERARVQNVARAWSERVLEMAAQAVGRSRSELDWLELKVLIGQERLAISGE